MFFYLSIKGAHICGMVSNHLTSKQHKIIGKLNIIQSFIIYLPCHLPRLPCRFFSQKFYFVFQFKPKSIFFLNFIYFLLIFFICDQDCFEMIQLEIFYISDRGKIFSSEKTFFVKPRSLIFLKK